MKLCARCGERPRAVTRSGLVRSQCRECRAADERAWQAANRERGRAISHAWKMANREHGRAMSRAWKAANPDRGQMSKMRRRARKAGAQAIVRLISAVCGVCRGPLHQGERWPDPLATTVGHEPPLARLEGLGAVVVHERPEHWACNQAKGTRLDHELVADRSRTAAR